MQANQRLELGDVEGHPFHGNQYTGLTDEPRHDIGIPKEVSGEDHVLLSDRDLARLWVDGVGDHPGYSGLAPAVRELVLEKGIPTPVLYRGGYKDDPSFRDNAGVQSWSTDKAEAEKYARDSGGNHLYRLDAGSSRGIDLERALKGVTSNYSPRSEWIVVDAVPDAVVAAANEDHTDSAMLAWRPSPKEQQQLALRGGEAPDQLHSTLIFLGKAAELDVKTVTDVTRAVAARFSPFTAHVSGYAIFQNEEENCLVALLDAPELEQLQQMLHDELIMAGIELPDTHGYTAHVTLKYLENDEVDPKWFTRPVFDVEVSAVQANIGTDMEDFPLATEVKLSGGLCAPLPSPPNKGLPTEGPHEDKHPPVQEQIEAQRKKKGKVPGYYGEDNRQDFGDVEGHAFHGNQYTGGFGGGGVSAKTSVRSDTENHALRAALLKDAYDAGAPWQVEGEEFERMTEGELGSVKGQIVREAGADIAEAARNDPDVRKEMIGTIMDELGVAPGIKGWEKESPDSPGPEDWIATLHERWDDSRMGPADSLEEMYGQRMAQRYIDTWTNSAADSDAVSLALQGAISDTLDARSASFEEFVHSDIADYRNADNDVATMRAFVQGTYDRTQEFLKDNGITNVTLYRGVSFGKDDPIDPFQGFSDGPHPIEMNPGSSWTVDVNIGKDFAGAGGGGYAANPSANNYLLTASVPAEDIISTSRTGWGALREGEIVVRNQPDSTAFVQRQLPETYPEDDYEEYPYA